MDLSSISATKLNIMSGDHCKKISPKALKGSDTSNSNSNVITFVTVKDLAAL